MNSNNISNAIDMIDEDMLNSAAEARKRGRVARFPVKAAIAACAAAALLIGALAGTYFLKGTENGFVLTVCAEELQEGHAVSLGKAGQADGFISYPDFDGERIDYKFSLPIVCEGKNIDSITYSLNKGELQVNRRESSEKLFGVEAVGDTYNDELKHSYIGGIHIITDAEKFNGTVVCDSYPVCDSYSEVTIDYGTQAKLGSEYFLSLAGTSDMVGEYEALHESDERGVEAKKEMLGDQRIYCTIQYTDGTTETAEVLVGVGDPSEREGEGDMFTLTLQRVQ